MSTYLVTVQVNHFIEAESVDASRSLGKAWAEAMNERTMEMPSQKVLSSEFHKPLFDSQTVMVVDVTNPSTDFEKANNPSFAKARRQRQ